MKINEVDKNFSIDGSNSSEIIYYNPINCSELTVNGLNWFHENQNYCRFPVEELPKMGQLAEGLPYLINQPSGAMLSFYTDSPTLKIKVKLGHTFNMAHMANTGQGGFDCYIGDDLDSLVFVKASVYYQKDYCYTFFENWVFEKPYLCLLNFPLYAEVLEVEVGIERGALLQKADNLFKGRVVWYGTSITQGGCACRGGISPSNALSRYFGYEFLNFGFSGNGRGQIEVAQLLASIENVDLFILDYEANAPLEMLMSTLEDFIKTIRKMYPNTPIIVMSKIKMGVELHQKIFLNKQNASLLFQKGLVQRLSKNDAHIFFIDGHKLLGERDFEGTVDGSHPNDYGFLLITNRLKKKLMKFLDK